MQNEEQAKSPLSSDVPASSDVADPAELAEKIAKARAKSLDAPKPESETPLPSEKKSKKPLFITIFIILFLVLAGGGGAAYYFLVYTPENSPVPSSQTSQESPSSPETPEQEKIEPEELPSEKFYSRLSGEPISSEAESSAPTYCVQIPNGLDGARPQAGLNSAKVVFEAIAERGITRFAAIFQNPPAVVGPIRSLRIYYFNWDRPFDCTIVHAGGANDAISALRSSGAKELDESTTYMWRTSANANLNRLWNNLFTSGDLMKSYNESKGYLSSNINSFPRMTPESALKNKINSQAVNPLKIDEPAPGDTNELKPSVTHINFRFGDIPSYNPVYDYDRESNTYRRSYETGAAHESYDCEGQSGTITPELVCPLKQISPSAIIAMIVQEKVAAYDNYHEDVSSLGAGDAYIFQNGSLVKGTWEKSSADEQIIFRNEAGETVSLIPGQTWISAVPAYGVINYE
ncbi:DUF3048 domain-containing protein [Candidatus Saccharibacteria bacterium]|nr:DUF3048 domain-containing protein [Candidatus Saccharibacteria bacterium]